MIKFAVIHLDDAIAYTVKKITVMRNHEESGCAFSQPIFQPFYHLYIKMVGWLIENQQVGIVEKHKSQSYPFFLPAG